MTNLAWRDDNGDEHWSSHGLPTAPVLGVPTDLTPEQVTAWGEALAPLFRERHQMVTCTLCGRRLNAKRMPLQFHSDFDRHRLGGCHDI